MQKKNGLSLVLMILIIACLLSGCGGVSSSKAEEKADRYFYDESTGKIDTSLSQNFDIKVEQWKYYYDADSSQDRILLSILIKNKTGRTIKDFNTVISLNPNADKLVASGTLDYDVFEPCDLVPRKTANGVSYTVDFLVERDEWLQELHTDKSKLLDEIRSITLYLSWRGGDETVVLVCDPLNIPADSNE